MRRAPSGAAFALIFAVCSAATAAGPAPSSSLDVAAARAYLDGRTSAWLAWDQAKSQGGGGTRCISCHTGLPAALAQSRLGDATSAEKELLANVVARVKGWDAISAWTRDGAAKDAIRPYYDEGEPSQQKADALATESVLNALVLVNYDARRERGELSAESRRALEILWSQQNERGTWSWLDFGIRPWEREGEYYGASLAAVAVGMAGPKYLEKLPESERAKLNRLRAALKDGFAKESLHNRLYALWASTVLPGVLDEATQRATVREALEVDAASEGWSILSLARKRGGTEQWTAAHAIPAGATQDGYATALVTFVLQQAKADSPRLARARGWLATQRVALGEGPVIYLNRKMDPASTDADEAMAGRFMRDAAAAFAVLALSEKRAE